MAEEEAQEEQRGPEIPLTGQPRFGFPDNLESIRYLSEDDSFTLDPDKDPDDPTAVLEGTLPAHIKTYFWAFLSKDSVLTWIQDGKEVDYIMEYLQLCKDSFEMSLPPEGPLAFSYETLRHLDLLDVIVRFRINRAIQGFERKQQTTQITEQYYGSRDSLGPGGGQRRQGNFLSRGISYLFGGKQQ